jgi:ABC-type spermidine/putrescine transport system permease subunit II
MGLDTVLSVMVLAVVALLLGAFALWRRGGQTKQVWLMLVLAAVVIGNVLIWIVPDSAGNAPVEQARQ